MKNSKYCNNNFYSVVIPVYNSQGVVRATVKRVRDFFITQALNFEVILVNDGSSDASWDVISSLAGSFPDVIAINLLRNYGQHHANLCGFREAKGSHIITMDDDLQNPPEEIDKLIQASEQGYDLVMGRFELKKHSLIRRLGSQLVGWLNRKIFGVEDDLVLSNFRIIRRDVIDRVCKDQSADPYIPGLVLKNSSERCNVLVKHQAREVGKSNYNWQKILRLVGALLFNHSAIPLRLGALLGFFIAGGSFLLSVFYLVSALISGTSAPGWATLVVLLSFFNGVLILLLSVIGEYLIRVLREVDSQQCYEVKEVVR